MKTKTQKSVKAEVKNPVTSTKTKNKTTRIKKNSNKTKEKAALDTKNVKDTIKMTVESKREIKYKYPEEIEGPEFKDERKTWRQKVRNKMKTLEAAVGKADNPAKAEKELKAYRKEVLLVP